MKGRLIKELHNKGIYHDPQTKEKLERCKTYRVIQIYNENK